MKKQGFKHNARSSFLIFFIYEAFFSIRMAHCKSLVWRNVKTETSKNKNNFDLSKKLLINRTYMSFI